jgi:multisubunit Na+/H+ antiporter MnhG subunit
VRALGQVLALLSGLAGGAVGIYKVGKRLGKNVAKLFVLIASLGLAGHILPFLHRAVRNSHRLSDIYNDAQAATITPPAAGAPETASQLASALQNATASDNGSHKKVSESAMHLWEELTSKYKHAGQIALLSTLLAVLAILLYKKMQLARAAHRHGGRPRRREPRSLRGAAPTRSFAQRNKKYRK